MRDEIIMRDEITPEFIQELAEKMVKHEFLAELEEKLRQDDIRWAAAFGITIEEWHARVEACKLESRRAGAVQADALIDALPKKRKKI